MSYFRGSTTRIDSTSIGACKTDGGVIRENHVSLWVADLYPGRTFER